MLLEDPNFLLHVIGSILSVSATCIGVILWHIFKSIQSLNVKLAVILEKVQNHDERIRLLERGRNHK